MEGGRSMVSYLEVVVGILSFGSSSPCSECPVVSAGVSSVDY